MTAPFVSAFGPSSPGGRGQPPGPARVATAAGWRLGACALGALVGMGAGAAPPGLSDPTRPAVSAPPAADGAAYGLRHPLRLAASRGPAAASAAADPVPLPQLQSVRLPRLGPPSALVDGRLLQVGDRLAGPWGERSIGAIDEHGLLLVAAGAKPQPALRLWLLGATAPRPAGPAGLPGDTAPPTPPTKLAGRSQP